MVGEVGELGFGCLVGCDVVDDFDVVGEGVGFVMYWGEEEFESLLRIVGLLLGECCVVVLGVGDGVVDDVEFVFVVGAQVGLVEDGFVWPVDIVTGKQIGRAHV